jgi:hypothetical protein
MILRRAADMWVKYKPRHTITLDAAACWCDGGLRHAGAFKLAAEADAKRKDLLQSLGPRFGFPITMARNNNCGPLLLTRNG